jgi:hypothetical protein
MPNKSNVPKKESTKKASATVAAKSEKAEKKSAKSADVDAEIETEAETPQIDQEELEEQEEEAAAESAGENGNAAALAAAGNPTEMSASFKNFRHHPDMENFYRFIYENDLRHEALAIIDEIMAEKQQRKLVKGAKSQAH